MTRQLPRPDSTTFAQLVSLYDDLERDIAHAAPRCETRGLCCDFRKSEHRLYASAVEVAFVLENRPDVVQDDQHLCPFFSDGLCRARAVRPLGCRLYFCDPGYAPAMEELSERYHTRLKALVDRSGGPWDYAPFVDAVRPSLAPSEPSADA